MAATTVISIFAVSFQKCSCDYTFNYACLFLCNSTFLADWQWWNSI